VKSKSDVLGGGGVGVVGGGVREDGGRGRPPHLEGGGTGEDGGLGRPPHLDDRTTQDGRLTQDGGPTNEERRAGRPAPHAELRDGPAAVAAYGRAASVLSLSEVCAVMGRLTGQKPSRPTVYRWMSVGLLSSLNQTCIRLASIAMPSGRCVAADQLVDFIAGINDDPVERETAVHHLRRVIAVYQAEMGEGVRLGGGVGKKGRRARTPAPPVGVPKARGRKAG